MTRIMFLFGFHNRQFNQTRTSEGLWWGQESSRGVTKRSQESSSGVKSCKNESKGVIESKWK